MYNLTGENETIIDFCYRLECAYYSLGDIEADRNFPKGLRRGELSKLEKDTSNFEPQTDSDVEEIDM